MRTCAGERLRSAGRGLESAGRVGAAAVMVLPGPFVTKRSSSDFPLAGNAAGRDPAELPLVAPVCTASPSSEHTEHKIKHKLTFLLLCLIDFV
jgi:hypothetical protein